MHKNCRNGSYYNTPLSALGPCFKQQKDPLLEEPVLEAGEKFLIDTLTEQCQETLGKLKIIEKHFEAL